MNKNTGDGELDEDELCRLASLVGTDARNPEANLVAYVREAIAQEANKAQQKLLQELMDEFQEARTWEDKSQRHAAGIFLDNDDQVIGYNEAISHGKSAIQNKLEGLS